MDAEEWAGELLRVIRAYGQGRARTFAEAGYPLPWGVELTLPTGARIYLQTVTDPSDSDHPPTGPVAPAMDPVELPAEGPTELAAVERWLGWCLTGHQSAWIREVELFQARRGRRSVPHGLAVKAHSGARMWIYFRHATPAGRDPRGMAVWRLQPTV
jgi:hypothetical protein